MTVALQTFDIVLEGRPAVVGQLTAVAGAEACCGKHIVNRKHYHDKKHHQRGNPVKNE